MAEYISRAALMGSLTSSESQSRLKAMSGADAYSEFLRMVNYASTADVQEVRHGKWIDPMVRDWRCSVCGEKIDKVRNVDGYCYDDKPNYCPNCGAKMDLEENHEG